MNTANPTLLVGGGIEGATHRAQDRIAEKCRALKGCLTGEAKITERYLLHSKCIIHTVGPIWQEEEKERINCLPPIIEKVLNLPGITP